jgi:hypothetical protein
VPKHSHRCADRASVCHRAEDFSKTRGGRREAIAGRSAAGTAGRAAGVTATGRAALVCAMRPIADTGVDVWVGQAILHAGVVGARKPWGAIRLGAPRRLLPSRQGRMAGEDG